MDIFAQISYVRHHRGKRHPLFAILALACVAMMDGYRRDSAIAEEGCHDSPRLMRLLGFPYPKTPWQPLSLPAFATSTESKWR
ncbi:MAG: transposase family protein [Chloroflexi bacterium]|nr:transposase family protein [Chloroflexota bacterium]